METKNFIRQAIKKKVSEISDKDLQAELTCKKLFELIMDCDSANILAFVPLKDEININPFLEELLFNNKKVYIPVSFDNGVMDFFRLNSFDNMKSGKYGISEPQRNEPYKYNPGDIIIVPGVAFDIKCNRMGRGKGYYDIFLNKFPLKSFGVCFDEQILESLPTEEHDIKMDLVISRNYTIKHKCG